MPRTALIAAPLLIFAQLAQAQTLSPTPLATSREARVSIGLTVPLGSAGTKAEQKPRLELGVDRTTRDSSGHELRDPFALRPNRPMRLGLTLQEQPRLMFNGREMEPRSNEKNLSTGAAIGIGVVVVLVVAGAVLLDRMEDASE